MTTALIERKKATDNFVAELQGLDKLRDDVLHIQVSLFNLFYCYRLLYIPLCISSSLELKLSDYAWRTGTYGWDAKRVTCAIGPSSSTLIKPYSWTHSCIYLSQFITTEYPKARARKKLFDNATIDAWGTLSYSSDRGSPRCGQGGLSNSYFKRFFYSNSYIFSLHMPLMFLIKNFSC